MKIKKKKRKKKSFKSGKKIVQVLIILFFFSMLSFSECTSPYTEKTECTLLEQEMELIQKRIELNPSETNYESLGLKMFECVQKQAENKGVHKENLPSLLHKPGNKKGVLLLHGFTASPWEVKELGNFLASKGFTVYAPLIAGHGTTPDDLKEISWKDWYASAVYGHQLVGNLVEEINVIGFSMGGLLSIILSSNYPVNNLITVNTPMIVRDKRIYFAGILKYFKEYAINTNIAKGDEDYYYTKRPISSVAELNYLINTAKLSLYKINSPIFVIQAKEDPTVDPFSAKIISHGVHSQNKNLLMVEDSSHTLFKGSNQKDIFDAILDFLE